MNNNTNNSFIKSYCVSPKNESVTMLYADGSTKTINQSNANNYGIMAMEKESGKRILNEYYALLNKAKYYKNLVLEQKIVNNLSPYLFYLTQQYESMSNATLISGTIYLIYKMASLNDYLDNEVLLKNLDNAKKFYKSRSIEKIRTIKE